MTESVNNLWWADATSDGGLQRQPRIPDLNVSRLPWLQAPAPHQGLSDACATWPPKETEVIGTTGQFTAMIGSREVETVFSNAPDGRLCHTNTLRCR